MEDRAADTWESLFVVAGLAGGDWPDRARRACLAMTGDEPDDSGDGTRLLADLYEIWAATEDYLPTATILQRLEKVEEGPWAEWGRKSEPITARGLAKLLRPYGVRSRSVRIGAETPKGYARADLTDPWARYVVGALSDTSATAPHDDENPDLSSEDGCGGCVADDFSKSATAPDQREEPVCGAVADVADDVRGSLFDAAPRTASGQTHEPLWETLPPAHCAGCSGPLWAPESIERGYCEGCFVRSKRETASTP